MPSDTHLDDPKTASSLGCRNGDGVLKRRRSSLSRCSRSFVGLLLFALPSRAAFGTHCMLQVQVTHQSIPPGRAAIKPATDHARPHARAIFRYHRRVHQLHPIRRRTRRLATAGPRLQRRVKDRGRTRGCSRSPSWAAWARMRSPAGLARREALAHDWSYAQALQVYLRAPQSRNRSRTLHAGVR